MADGDKRKSIRATISLQLDFQRPGTGGAGPRRGRTVNLSMGGMALKSRDPVEKGEELRLSLPGPGEPLSVVARVVECREDDDEVSPLRSVQAARDAWVARLSFVDMSPRAEAALRDMLSKALGRPDVGVFERAAPAAAPMLKGRNRFRLEYRLEYQPLDRAALERFRVQERALDLEAMGTDPLFGRASRALRYFFPEGGLALSPVGPRPSGEGGLVTCLIPGYPHSLRVLTRAASWDADPESPGLGELKAEVRALPQEDALVLESFLRERMA